MEGSGGPDPKEREADDYDGLEIRLRPHEASAHATAQTTAYFVADRLRSLSGDDAIRVAAKVLAALDRT